MSGSLERYDYFWKSGTYVLHKFKEGGDIVDHCRIYDTAADGYVKIEDMNDYTLGNEIVRRMQAEGVPVVRELPPGAFFMHRVWVQMHEAGFAEDDVDEFNRAWAELVELKKRGASHEEIERQLQELLDRGTQT
jgi:hypothetical protein